MLIKKKKILVEKKNSNQETFTDKKICFECKGKTRQFMVKNYLINTNYDKKIFVNEYFLNNNDGYIDIIFNIIDKEEEEQIFFRENRYDISYTRYINLQEFYLGGNFIIKYLDNKYYKIKFNSLYSNNLLYEHRKVIHNMGLIIDNSSIRGNLIIILKLFIPSLDIYLKYKNMNNFNDFFTINENLKNIEDDNNLDFIEIEI